MSVANQNLQPVDKASGLYPVVPLKRKQKRDQGALATIIAQLYAPSLRRGGVNREWRGPAMISPPPTENYRPPERGNSPMPGHWPVRSQMRGPQTPSGKTPRLPSYPGVSPGPVPAPNIRQFKYPQKVNFKRR